MYKFKKLRVWNDAIEFISFIYKVSNSYPKFERFGLTDQIRRAAVSIALNIAEGSGSGSDKEFVRFLYFALRSLFEVVTAVEVAKKLKYGNESENNAIMEQANEIGAKIQSLINYLKKSKDK